MDITQYKAATHKEPPKKKPRTRPLPKAKQAYLEAEQKLIQELYDANIGYVRKFQFEPTKNWRFDFHVVCLRLLIEIAGSAWSVGRGGKKIANAYSKYDYAESMGYKVIRFEPCHIESGYVIHWIKEQLEIYEDGTNQTIPTD